MSCSALFRKNKLNSSLARPRARFDSASVFVAGAAFSAALTWSGLAAANYYRLHSSFCTQVAQAGPIGASEIGLMTDRRTRTICPLPEHGLFPRTSSTNLVAHGRNAHSTERVEVSACTTSATSQTYSCGPIVASSTGPADYALPVNLSVWQNSGGAANYAFLLVTLPTSVPNTAANLGFFRGYTLSNPF